MENNYESMSDDEMNGALVELGKSYYYQAILRYIKQRDKLTIDAIVSTDPFKEPTTVARSQGIRSGLWDLPGMIQILTDRANKEEKEPDGQE